MSVIFNVIAFLLLLVGLPIIATISLLLFVVPTMLYLLGTGAFIVLRGLIKMVLDPDLY